MLIGHEELAKNFEKLAKANNLSHCYIFFGDPQVGKFTFGKYLANFLEGGEFDLPKVLPRETLEIQPSSEGSIGIDEVRDLKYFLSQKPITSSKRTVLINNAETMTHQAQNAILKIAEEPPASSLIILITSNPESLLPTVQSRFVKVYFGRVISQDLIKFLVKNYKLKTAEAAKIVGASFGRPGRSIEILESEELKNIRKKVARFIKYPRERADFLRSLEYDKDITLFLKELMAELALNIISNAQALSRVSGAILRISEFNTNKRLQLEAALWNI